MTAISWAIIIYTIVTDTSLKSSSPEIQNFAYGLAIIGFMFIFVLTIKDILK